MSARVRNGRTRVDHGEICRATPRSAQRAPTDPAALRTGRYTFINQTHALGFPPEDWEAIWLRDRREWHLMDNRLLVNQL